MKAAGSVVVALVTAPDRAVARRLARLALEHRLIACANLVPGVESHYRWQGKLESAREILLLLKTRRACLAALEKLITSAHPYDTPEFLVLDVRGGAKRYLNWVLENVGGG